MKHISTPLQTKTIPVTVDKSHLVLIGERLYSQSLELIRELVSNAYDADATHVWIDITPYTLVTRDNGSGMDEAGLKQYFTIGSQEKKINSISPVYHRKRIGEFGIGKFAVLSACDVFIVATQKDDFAARLTFDKILWNNIEGWELPFEILKSNPHRGNGTTVTLERLKKELTIPDVGRFIRERVPLKAPNFNVYLNGKKIVATIIPGKKFPIRRETSYGIIRGEIIMPNFSHHLATEPKGIECFVRNVLVRRETFGFEYSHTFASSKLTGELHADFLPITSDRCRFVSDSPEYKEFYRIMRQEIGDVLKKVKIAGNTRDEQKADKILRDALSHIKKALKKNPEFAPRTHVPISKEKSPYPIPPEELNQNEIVETDTDSDKTIDGSAKPDLITNSTSHTEDGERKKPDRSSKRVRVRTLKGKEVVARRMQMGEFSIVCKTDSFDENAPPVLWESGIIFINRSHPLYKRFTKNNDTLTLYITELITQEISKLRARSSKEAFELQNQILTDAWG